MWIEAENQALKHRFRFAFRQACLHMISISATILLNDDIYRFLVKLKIREIKLFYEITKMIADELGQT